jgi:hypothetical protein
MTEDEHYEEELTDGFLNAEADIWRIPAIS